MLRDKLAPPYTHMARVHADPFDGPDHALESSMVGAQGD